jgi:hypothetical protein
MLGGYPPAFLFQRSAFLKCLVGIHQPFYFKGVHFKNAWWVSTSLFISKECIFKMLGGYPPAFLFQRSAF